LVIPGQINNPTPGSKLTSASQVFSWNTGVGVSNYQLTVGTSQGASDIYSGPAVTGFSALVSGLPTTGGTIWARLSSNVAGGWQYLDSSYTAAGVPVFTDLSAGTVVFVEGEATQTTSLDTSAGDLIVA